MLQTGFRIGLAVVLGMFAASFGCEPVNDVDIYFLTNDAGTEAASKGNSGAAGDQVDAGDSGAAGQSAAAGKGGGAGTGGLSGAGGSNESGAAGVSGGGASSVACDPDIAECDPGESKVGNQACGTCNLGKQMRMQICKQNCTWGEWSSWSECSAVTPPCNPGQVQTEQQACGDCNTGKQTRTRTCSKDTCTWGGWSGWSACGNVTAECQPNHFRCCGNGKWEWCYTNSCTWTGSCAACTKPNCDC